MIISWELPLDQ